jgi:SAM-dependent methyltransferase
MSAIWTIEGDEETWHRWAERMAGAPPSPLAERVLAGRVYPPGAWALDVGTGTGRALAPLGRTGCRILALDPVMDGLEASLDRAALEEVEAKPVQGVASQLPVRDGSIRMALAISVLFQLGPAELAAALEEIGRVLAPGGEAILHFLDLGDWRLSLGIQTPPERVPSPAYHALVTCFATQDTICDWLLEADLRLDRMELDVQQAEPGERRSWIAYVRR